MTVAVITQVLQCPGRDLVLQTGREVVTSIPLERKLLPTHPVVHQGYLHYLVGGSEVGRV